MLRGNNEYVVSLHAFATIKPNYIVYAHMKICEKGYVVNDEGHLIRLTLFVHTSLVAFIIPLSSWYHI